MILTNEKNRKRRRNSRLARFFLRLFVYEFLAYEYPERKVYHLCIVNLVIGTLYCSKGNFEFGITRVIKVIISKKKMILTPHFSLWNHFKKSSEWTLGFMSNDVSCLSWNLFQSISSWFPIMFYMNASISLTIANSMVKRSRLEMSIHSGTVQHRVYQWYTYFYSRIIAVINLIMNQ